MPQYPTCYQTTSTTREVSCAESCGTSPIDAAIEGTQVGVYLMIQFLAAFLFSFTLHAENSLIRLQYLTFDPSHIDNAHLLTASDNQKLWILSLSEPVNEDLKKQITSQGLEILDFIPDQALLVRGDKLTTTLSSVTQWIPFQPSWKWSTDMRRPSVIHDQEARIVLIRTFKVSETLNVKRKIEQFMDRTLVLHRSSPYLVVRSYDRDLYKISELNEVAFLQELPEFETLMVDLGKSDSDIRGGTITGFETGTKVMNLTSVWDQGFTGSGQVIAMGDTGLDRGSVDQIHSDFSKAVLFGQNFAPFGKSWEDSMGHGSHVAGSILSRGTQSQGVFRGAAFGAQLIVHSLLSPLLNNLMVPTQLRDLFSAAKKQGASFHTNSWGSLKSFGTYDSFTRQVDEFTHQNPDFLILFAAGNSGVDQDRDGRIDANSIGTPATAKNALSVGASENFELQGGIQRKVSELRGAADLWKAEPIYSSKISDHPKGLAMFSSRGPTDDGRIKPDLVAPGTNILSTRSFHKKAQDLWGRYDDHYVWSGGTSMSTPLVTGAAALVREIMQKKWQIQNPSAALIKATLMVTSSDLFPGQYGPRMTGQELLTTRPNSDQGFGLVNMAAVLDLKSTAFIDQKLGVATAQTQTHEIHVGQNSKLSILVLWNDAPANENAAKALVNDLTLSIKGPGVDFKSTDTTNNFRFFENNANQGTYQIQVTGRQVAMGINGKQPYAVVVQQRPE